MLVKWWRMYRLGRLSVVKLGEVKLQIPKVNPVEPSKISALLQVNSIFLKEINKQKNNILSFNKETPQFLALRCCK
jgi:hypothetical protein